MNKQQKMILAGRICPYCKEKTNLVDSAVIYDRSYGMIYLCAPCNAYVGVHKGTHRALGRVANAELREWKKNAHMFFDPIWQDGIINRIMPQKIGNLNVRQKAYHWLSKQTGIPEKLCHIGMMDVKQCKKVVEVCKNELSK